RGCNAPRHSTIARNTATCPTHFVHSAASLRRSTTKSGCTRPWAICRLPNSRPIYRERTTVRRPLRGSFRMSFFRHREIFRPDVIRSVRERRNRRSPAHRLDEFPVGYSSPSCTPALLASASPTGIHSATQARRRQRSFQPTANCVLTFCATPGDNRKEYTSTTFVSHVLAAQVSPASSALRLIRHCTAS